MSSCSITPCRFIPARMSHSRKNVSIDFFKPLYLRQKHIFCKSGDDKLLGLVCFIIWRFKIYFTTLCFFKSCIFNFSLNFLLLCAKWRKHWQSPKIHQKKRNFMKKLFLLCGSHQKFIFQEKIKKNPIFGIWLICAKTLTELQNTLIEA